MILELIAKTNSMRLFSIAFIFSLLLLSGKEWGTDIDAAKATAKKENKLVLLNFSGSDWCIPCIKLHDEIFESETFKNYASEKLVLVNADFPRLKKNQLSKDQQKKNDATAEQYNNKGHFPFTVLLNADGKILYTWDGYPEDGLNEFMRQLKSLSDGK